MMAGIHMAGSNRTPLLNNSSLGDIILNPVIKGADLVVNVVNIEATNCTHQAD
jgi:hypothetical protein